MLLAGDIGGTKTAVALFSTDSNTDTLQPVVEMTFQNRNYSSLEEVIYEFMRDNPKAITSASFGVAGPVVKGRANITNLPWVIDQEAIQKAFDFPKVHLLNDLESIASAVPHLTSEDLVTLNEGTAEPEGAIAVIAPGTGLGEAFLVWDGDMYRAHPSEGGHVSFGPTNPDQVDLLVYMIEKFGHVSVERVCSGSGIPNIYACAKHHGRFPEPEWLQKQLAEAIDPAPIIVEAAIQHGVHVARAADVLKGNAIFQK